MTGPLNVAVVHYHLRPGGVTRVIERSVAALNAKSIRVVVLTGETPVENRIQCGDIRVVRGLSYDQTGATDGRDLLDRMIEAAQDVLGGEPDIWHFHNHSLGKNLAVPCAVELMAREDMPLLLQIHDFPEDGRPGNYRLLFDEIGEGDAGILGLRLYPRARHVHYAVLNGRDLGFLSEAGMPEEQLHYLPNPVCLEAPEGPVPEALPGKRLFLYPSRAIRRKNIGEFILWSALADEDEKFAISRSPANPVFRPVYEQWVKLATALSLPVEFDYVAKSELSFHELMRAAYAIVSTSVAEGFGLGFLEPWFVGKLLVGRKLPEITKDFEKAGIDFRCMYTFLGVPVEWIGENVLHGKVETELAKFLERYGRKLMPGQVERALSAMVKDDRVDFARLDETLQGEIVRKVSGSRSARREISPNSLGVERGGEEIINANCRAVNDNFSLEKYGDRLERMYESVMESGTTKVEGISAEVLLDRFLAPERFYLLRTT